MRSLSLFFLFPFFSTSSPSSQDDNTKSITVFDGGYMAVSGLYALLLASGYDPVQSVGYASLAFVPIIQHYFESLPDGTSKVMGVDATVLGYVAVVLMSALTVGTLEIGGGDAGAPATPAD